jgi:hypothetical protein
VVVMVVVRACVTLRAHAGSHVGGHKFAGNVLLFSSKIEGEWLGYVTPDDVPSIARYLEQQRRSTSNNNSNNSNTALPPALAPLLRGRLNTAANPSV